MASSITASRIPLADITSRGTSVKNTSEYLIAKTQKIVHEGSLLRPAFPSSQTQVFSSSASSSVDAADLFNDKIPSLECTEVELKALQIIAATAPKGFFGVIESIILRNIHLLSQKSMESAPEEIIEKMIQVQIEILQRFHYMISIENVFKNECDFIGDDVLFFLNFENDNKDKLIKLFSSEIVFISSLIEEIKSPYRIETLSLQHTCLSELRINLQALEKLSRLTVQDLKSLSFNEDKKCERCEEAIEEDIQRLVSLYEYAIKDKKVAQLFKSIIPYLERLRICGQSLDSIESIYKVLPKFDKRVHNSFKRYKERIDAEKANPGTLSEGQFNRTIQSACQVLMMGNFIERTLQSILYCIAHKHDEKKFREFSEYTPHCLQSLQLADQIKPDDSLEEISGRVKKIHQSFIDSMDRIYGYYSEGNLYEDADSIKEMLNDQDLNSRLYQFYGLQIAVDRNLLSEDLELISVEFEKALAQLVSRISRAQSKIDNNELESLKAHIFAEGTHFRALLHVISGLHAYLLATNSYDQSLDLDSISEFKGFENTSLFLDGNQIVSLNKLLEIFTPELIFEMDEF